MGGKALSVETKRLDQDEYLALEQEVITKFTKLGYTVEPVKAYKTKPSYGDMDVLILKTDFNNFYDILKTEFQTKDIHSNGNVVSFEYKDFQVDVIKTSSEDWQTSLAYYQNDPHGNIVGKLYHSLGLKWGWDGLIYPLRSEKGTMSSEVVLSKDPFEIFNFMGLDYKQFQDGFDTLENIFGYIVNAKYFSPSKYLKADDEKSHIDRRREKLRPSYVTFIEWLVKQDFTNKTFFEFDTDKSVYISLIDKAFPDTKLKEKIDAFNDNQKKIAEVHLKFNGSLVMALFPTLKGKDLGNFITCFKDHIATLNSVSFDDYIVNSNEEQIKQDLLNYYQDKHIK